MVLYRSPLPACRTNHGITSQSVLSGLTLEQCLDAYTREETLEKEDSWYCSNCQAHRKGIMKIDLWKMPDVLVSYLVAPVSVRLVGVSHTLPMALETREYLYLYSTNVDTIFALLIWYCVP